MGPRSTLAPTLVARRRELTALREALDGGGRLIVLRGLPGIGKSRLVREITGDAAQLGSKVLTGRCTAAGQGVALRPVAEALLGAARAGWQPPQSMAGYVPPLARWVPEWGTSSDADGSVLVLAEGVLRFAAALATPGAPTLLVLEDVHWADTDTATLVEYIADAIEALPVVVVVTCRTTTAGPGAELVDRLAVSRRATVVDVGPLDQVEVAEFARACLATDELPIELVTLLAARSDGVPFLIEELLTSMASLEELDRVLPSSVLASVQARLAELPDASVRLVRCAALLGRHFDWSTAAAAADVGSSDAIVALRAATASQLFERERGGYRFRHELTRDAVLADILEAELPQLRRRVLDELVRVDPDLTGDHAAIAAELALKIADPRRAADATAVAARRALADGSLAAAESMARRAVELDGTDRGHGLLLLSVLNQTGNFDEARALAEQMRADAAGDDQNDELAEVCVELAVAAIHAGRWADADTAIDQARAATADDDQGRLDVLAAQVAIAGEDALGAVALAEHAATSPDPVTRCEALEVIGRVERLRDLSRAERAFDQALATARQHGLRTWEIRALQELGTIDMYTTLDIERLLAARQQSEVAGAVSTMAIVDLQLAAVLGERIELDESVAAARRCQDSSARFGLPTLGMAFGLEASAHAKARHRDELERAVERALATRGDEANVEIVVWGNAWASFHLHGNDRALAFEALDRSMITQRRARIAGTPFSGMWALLATLLDHPDAAAMRDEIRVLELDTPMSQAMVDAADAVDAGDGGDAEAATRHLASSETTLSLSASVSTAPDALAGGSRAHAAGWGSPDAWLRESLAGFEQLGLDELARACRGDLKMIGAVVPRTRGPSSVPTDLAGLGITSRELDVLVLIGDGLGNRQIAERLFMSPRTVEKHVERLKMKSGRDRGGLVALAAGVRT